MQETSETKEILENEIKSFRTYIAELWAEKNRIFSLFRSRLEEKKIQEIKNHLLKK